MAVALILPKPQKLKRKQKPINGDHGVASQRIADARTILSYSRELAEAVMRDGKKASGSRSVPRTLRAAAMLEKGDVDGYAVWKRSGRGRGLAQSPERVTTGLPISVLRLPSS